MPFAGEVTGAETPGGGGAVGTPRAGEMVTGTMVRGTDGSWGSSHVLS